jgi:glucose/arabinose dehydrogenase
VDARRFGIPLPAVMDRSEHAMNHPKRMSGFAVAAAALGLAGLAWLTPPAWAAPEDDLAKIKLPPGFAISLYARVPNARSMAVTPNSRVVIVTTRQQTLWAVVDDDGDYQSDGIIALQESLNAPSGVAYRDGYLYVAEQHRVRRAEFDENRPQRLLIWKPVKTGLSDTRHHGTRELAFGPDGRMYLAIGAPCNICLPAAPDDAILSFAPDGSNEAVFATGVRNSVGIDFHPLSREIWFTDNGADTMGDDIPPDELNRAKTAGGFYGFPYFGGGRERTAEFRDKDPPKPLIFPEVELDAHGAALGIHFYRGTQFPPDYRNDLFVAQHGSWNRSKPVGYRILRIRFDKKGDPVGREVFAEGWLEPSGPWGRPNDIAELKDGSLLVTDDYAGVIYRITYNGR